jgi:hypothetical protein
VRERQCFALFSIIFLFIFSRGGVLKANNISKIENIEERHDSPTEECTACCARKAASNTTEQQSS